MHLIILEKNIFYFKKFSIIEKIYLKFVFLIKILFVNLFILGKFYKIPINFLRQPLAALIKLQKDNLCQLSDVFIFCQTYRLIQKEE